MNKMKILVTGNDLIMDYGYAHTINVKESVQRAVKWYKDFNNLV